MLGIGITRQTQNAWVNLIWEINKYIDVGLQYDYGTQTLQSGSVTPNQQIQLTVQLSATPKAQTGGADTPSTRDFAHGYSAGAEAASTGLSNRRL
jgi:hypothetical protein